MPYDNMKLKQDLMTDVAAAEQAAGQQAQARGAPELPAEEFAPKRLRVGARVIAQKEMSDSDAAIDRTVKKLMETASFRDDTERGLYEHELRGKMNKYKTYMMQQAGQFNSEIAKRALDNDQKEAFMQSIFKLGEGASQILARQLKIGGGEIDTAGQGGVGPGQRFQP